MDNNTSMANYQSMIKMNSILTINNNNNQDKYRFICPKQDPILTNNNNNQDKYRFICPKQDPISMCKLNYRLEEVNTILILIPILD